MGKGYLKIQTVTANTAVLVGRASVTVTNENNQVLYELYTDDAGNTPIIELKAPDKWFIEVPAAPGLRYGIYNVTVRASGYVSVINEGVMVFDMSTSILKVELDPLAIGQENAVKHMYIAGHKMDQPIMAQQQMEPQALRNAGKKGAIPRILPAVAIPYFITVHLGRHTAQAQNVRVPFLDYIKNVTSHEIFDEWSEEALIANIYCIVSLTLNRIYTEFYRSMGYSFDITSETYMDQKFIYGGVIGAKISALVDRLFNNYLAVVGHNEPFLSLYNDGNKVNIPGRLSQWGSFYDARDRHMNAWQIIKKYYSQNLELRECGNHGDVPESYPGYTLTLGSRGDVVRSMQLYLNRILGRYTDIIINPADGVYGQQTRSSVILFQKLYNLPQNGQIDRRNWYEISRIYAVEKGLWEMYSEGERIGIGVTPPKQVIRQGDTGTMVLELQFLLGFIAMYHSEIPFAAQTSRFDSLTAEGVRVFQRMYGVAVDGVVGATTWRMLYDVYWGIMQNTVPPKPIPPVIPPQTEIPPFPGVSLSIGSTGPNVRLVQEAINKLAEVTPGLWKIAADGIFGNGTRAAVVNFQSMFGLTADGIVGPNTWRRLMEEAGSVSPPVTPPSIPAFPGSLSVGSTGPNVRLVQEANNKIAPYHPGVLWQLTVDGIFGPMTRDAAFAYQSVSGLPVTGVVNQATWDKLMLEAVSAGRDSRQLQIVQNYGVLRNYTVNGRKFR